MCASAAAVSSSSATSASHKSLRRLPAPPLRAAEVVAAASAVTTKRMRHSIPVQYQHAVCSASGASPLPPATLSRQNSASSSLVRYVMCLSVYSVARAVRSQPIITYNDGWHDHALSRTSRRAPVLRRRAGLHATGDDGLAMRRHRLQPQCGAWRRRRRRRRRRARQLRLRRLQLVWSDEPCVPTEVISDVSSPLREGVEPSFDGALRTVTSEERDCSGATARATRRYAPSPACGAQQVHAAGLLPVCEEGLFGGLCPTRSVRARHEVTYPG